MEENVRSYEESSSKPFSFTAKYLGRYVVFQITMIVSVIAFIVAFLYAGIRVQIYGTEVAFDDTTVVIIVLLGAIGLGTLIAASIGQFFTKRKIGQVNPELQKVWSAEKKKLIASGANAVANAVLKDGVLKDAANTANSIYQTIQAFKQRRAAINGINMELERAGMDAEGKGKGAWISFIVGQILAVVILLLGVGLIFLRIKDIPEGDPQIANIGASMACFVLAGMFASALIDLFVFTKYLNDAKNFLLTKGE